LHILHIIESLTTGGKERQLIELARGMEAVGEATTIVVMSEDISYDLSGLEGVTILELDRRARHDPGYVARLYHLVRRLQPNVIHSWGSMCSVFAAPVAQLTGAVFVNGIVRDAPPALDWRNKDYRRARLTFPFSDAVVGNSNAGLRAYRAPSGRSACIYNGFDGVRLHKLKPADEVRRELGIVTPYVVGMTASFSNRKDYRSFFEAAKVIALARDDVTFVAIGAGEQLEPFREAYPAQAFPYIRILGRRGDVESIAAACHVGVLMSNAEVHGEGIPNAVMEFMALAKPVVVSASGGVAELLSPGEHGFIVADKDVAGLVERLSYLIDTPQQAAALGRNGAERVRTQFGIDRMVQAHQELYARLLRKKTAARPSGPGD
jgi:glycosyltransferase involved in cell wall biosynthesis